MYNTLTSLMVLLLIMFTYSSNISSNRTKLNITSEETALYLLKENPDKHYFIATEQTTSPNNHMKSREELFPNVMLNPYQRYSTRSNKLNYSILKGADFEDKTNVITNLSRTLTFKNNISHLDLPNCENSSTVNRGSYGRTNDVFINRRSNCQMFYIRISKRISKRDIPNNATKNDSTVVNKTYVNNTLSDEDYLVEIEDFIFPKTWTWVLIFFHFIVFVIGLVGNTLVCVAVYRNHTMRTVTNYFIMNLAVADFLVILFCLPPTVIWDVTMTWFFGITLCKIVLYLQTVSVTVSVLTLTFISVDRWYAICYPLKFKSTTSRAKTAIAIIWLLGLTFDIPELVVYRTVKNEEIEIDTIYFTQCAPSWSIDTDTSWTVLKLILLYATPLVFMTATYCQIVRVLWKSGQVNHHPLGVVGNRQINTFVMNTNTNMEGQLRSRKKAAKMLVAVVVMFAFCYFPVHLLSVLRLTIGLTNSDTNRAFALISHWLCYANSAVNPIIYNFMSGKFRKEFRRAFDCCSASDRDQLGYELNSLYYKNTMKDSAVGSNHFRSLKRTDTQRTNNVDTNFIHRRSTKTSVIKMDV